MIRKLKKIWRKWNLLREIANDFWQTKEATLKQKFWAYKRGFFSSRVIMYGLNDENYSEYLSDFAYIKLQPVNGYYSKWIDDKLTIKYIFQPFNQYLPRYYYHLTNKGSGALVTRLMDCPAEYGAEITDIVKLLKAEGCLVAKLIAGSRSTGFYKITYSENNYYINQTPVSKNEMVIFLEKLNGYLITEYLFTHKDLGKIWNKSPNTLRITTGKAEGAQPQIVASFICFGTEKSWPVDEIDSVVATVDVDAGYFSNGRIIINNQWVENKLHPDTKVPVEGTLPFWNQIKATVLAICNYLPQMKLMGFDIIITDNGFKIIEINSRPAIYIDNYYCPIYTNVKYKEFLQSI